ncbi:GNAT family N-acetyltransferase [Pseudomonas huanghezhanensis]|uniref:GNAT family N-acetyltransferase n=1 Tax=Pseudomonas huanghezhanensis TaxID=3002903 RepID=UPI00228560F7|nr:GNAT family N-acetyltransferase [Pseudomonas sp. BSw22131]
MPATSQHPETVNVLPLTRAELAQACELVRLAFATFIEAAEPGEFWNDRDYVHNRWNAPHSNWLKAEIDGRMVGVLCVSRWGSHAVVGPVAVHPQFWDRAIAKSLMTGCIEQLDAWGVSHAGLMTFPDSAKHIGLYQRFGFWPRSLIAILQHPVSAESGPTGVLKYGAPGSDAQALKNACAAITHAIAPGLDVTGEMDAVREQKLGTTLILVDEAAQPHAFAICHFGPHSEAGAGVFYVKFAAVASGPRAPSVFATLIAACNAAAVQASQETLTVGVNTARDGAYRWLIDEGFRTDILGISMHRGGAGYDHAQAWILDDWR